MIMHEPSEQEVARLQDMEGVVVKVFQANIEVASKLIPLPITAQEAKDALRGINATWVGRLKESNRSLVLAGQCQLDPAAIYHLHLQEQKGSADHLRCL